MMTVAEYDAAELEAKVGLSFAEIMAFAPRTFAALGFPDRVRDDRELVRYADWNRDTGNQEYFRPGHFFGGPAVQTDYTHDEVELMDRARDQCLVATGKLGRPVRPLCGPFAQLGLFRILAAIGLPGLRVFEVGPGTAYLGAMLINAGAAYYSFTDNAQALFLWQCRLMAEVGYQLTPRVGLPWWDFARGRNLPPVDVVVSNTNLGEMTGDALKITAVRARQMLEGSALGLFLFVNIGAPMHNSEDGVARALMAAGFRLMFSQLFKGYVPNRALGPLAVTMPATLGTAIPLYNPSGRPGTVSGGEAVHLPDDQRPLDLAVTELLEGWRPPTRKNP
jgi:hypothetical protein